MAFAFKSVIVTVMVSTQAYVFGYFIQAEPEPVEGVAVCASPLPSTTDVTVRAQAAAICTGKLLLRYLPSETAEIARPRATV